MQDRAKIRLEMNQIIEFANHKFRRDGFVHHLLILFPLLFLTSLGSVPHNSHGCKGLGFRQQQQISNSFYLRFSPLSRLGLKSLVY